MTLSAFAETSSRTGRPVTCGVRSDSAPRSSLPVPSSVFFCTSGTASSFAVPFWFCTAAKSLALPESPYAIVSTGAPVCPMAMGSFVFNEAPEISASPTFPSEVPKATRRAPAS